ncbi:tyrosine-type recombinase/integrase [Pseudoalteromonas ruthenica]|uniref:tyrosine-type recombinase/integrase n=1 Tax=Pseudoalteromonas ruthenica TaxID=151081 RepID=UPI00110A1BD2|nr:tyrosine-type recombinase/integrase [Pseudoalteromonas ruthenica]TMP23758.1 hypothetical protein CWC06_09395 [Pseudoalteromonas ruthenica]
MARLTAKLSESLIKKHLEQAEISEFKDSRHPLVLRLHSKRDKGSWYIVDHRNDKWHRVGSWPAISAHSQLAMVPEHMARLSLGKPLVINQFDTVGDLLGWYKNRVDGDRTISKKRRKNVLSSLSKHLIPTLKNEPLSSFSKRELESKLLWPLQQKYELSTVRQHFQIVKRAFGQAISSGQIEAHAIASTKFGDFIKAKIQPKPCSLSAKDEADLACQLLDPKSPKHMLCWFMFLHGTRIGETRQLRYDYIDAEQKLIQLPSAITKTKALTVYLSDQAFNTLISYHQEMTGKGYKSIYLFPSKTKGPIDESEASRWVKQVSAGEYSSHDFRKLFRTRLLDLGVDSVIAELLLNHELTDLQKTYIKTDSPELRRAALQRWADHLQAKKEAAQTETGPRSYDFLSSLKPSAYGGSSCNE